MEAVVILLLGQNLSICTICKNIAVTILFIFFFLKTSGGAKSKLDNQSIERNVRKINYKVINYKLYRESGVVPTANW